MQNCIFLESYGQLFYCWLDDKGDGGWVSRFCLKSNAIRDNYDQDRPLGMFSKSCNSTSRWLLFNVLASKIYFQPTVCTIKLFINANN